MTALSDFQLQMNAAQKAGKITVDQLIAARDKLFKETQAAQSANNWTAYCKAIDDMRAELGCDPVRRARPSTTARRRPPARRLAVLVQPRNAMVRDEDPVGSTAERSWPTSATRPPDSRPAHRWDLGEVEVVAPVGPWRHPFDDLRPGRRDHRRELGVGAIPPHTSANSPSRCDSTPPPSCGRPTARRAGAARRSSAAFPRRGRRPQAALRQPRRRGCASSTSRVRARAPRDPCAGCTSTSLGMRPKVSISGPSAQRLDDARRLIVVGRTALSITTMLRPRTGSAPPGWAGCA